MTPNQVIIIGNYVGDEQQSMLRYASWLDLALRGRSIQVVSLSPAVVFSKWGRGRSPTIGKWLGYVDKYILFPINLRRILRRKKSAHTVIHIADHSNAVYEAACRGIPVVITCHDVLAIRAGLGDTTAGCRTSMMGRWLQKWILHHLRRIPDVLCCSAATKRDFLSLTMRREDPRVRITLNALNAPFRYLPDDASMPLLAQAGVPLDRPYLLHVGSSLPRKNRVMLPRVLAHLSGQWNGMAVLAGEALSGEESAQVSCAGCGDRVRVVKGPDHKLLCALYSRAHALVFPSLSEGFGWPIVEAQACDCPVVVSNKTAVPEVAGPSAPAFDPDDVVGFCKAIMALESPAIRAAAIQQGRENLQRFRESIVLDQICEAYAAALSAGAKRFS